MRVSEIMTKTVDTIAPEEPVFGAAMVMKQKNVGSVPIMDAQNKLVGILTDRDIVLRVVCEARDPKMTVTKDVMTTDLHTVNSGTDVHEAAKIMSDYQIRRLPVVDGDELVGIVALGDVAVENIFVNEAGDALHTISKPKQAVM